LFILGGAFYGVSRARVNKMRARELATMAERDMAAARQAAIDRLAALEREAEHPLPPTIPTASRAGTDTSNKSVP
jgi:hypothetical protein